MSAYPDRQHFVQGVGSSRGSSWYALNGYQCSQSVCHLSLPSYAKRMSESRPQISLYLRARRYMFCMIIAMPLIMWCAPVLLTSMGASSRSIPMFEMAFAALWLLVGGIGSLLLSCPKCGKLLFMRGFMSVPWPAKTCRKCGLDLTSHNGANPDSSHSSSAGQR